MKLNKVILFISVIVGIICGIIGNILFEGPFLKLPPLLGVLLYFVFVYIIITVFRVLVKIFKDGVEARTFQAAGLMFVLVIIFALLFEFIYEFGLKKEPAAEPDNYVFLIDNSGSMAENDAQQKRYEVYNELVGMLDSDKTVGMYTFENEVKEIVPVGSPVGDAAVEMLNNEAAGGTAMMLGIATAGNDITQKRLDGARIVILTDGVAGDKRSVKLKDIIQNLRNDNISISSVGFGNADESYLKKLARGTNGIYVGAENADQLYDSMNEAINYSGDGVNRTLVSSRLDDKMNSVLYAVLRIMFLIIIGILLSFNVLLIFNDSTSYKTLITYGATALFSVLAAILAELFMNIIGFYDGFARIVICVLWASLFLMETERPHGSGRAEKYDFGDFGSSGTFDQTPKGFGNNYGGDESAKGFKW